MSNYFYRYYTVNQHLYNSIINNELYFSNPRNFNDPFDSLPRYTTTIDRGKLKRFYTFVGNYLNQSLPNVKNVKNFENKHQDFKRLFDTYAYILKSFEFYQPHHLDFEERAVELYTFYSNENYFNKMFNINVAELQSRLYLDFIYLTIDINKRGIICGSLKPNCPLMWGHYADSHTGICIKYELDKDFLYDEKIELEVLKINYSDTPLDIFDCTNSELSELKFKIFGTKYSKWNYEHEVRAISNQGLIKIKRSKIKEIIFGYKSSPRERFSILRLLASLGYNIEKLSMARMLPDAYELDIQPMIMNDIANSGVYVNELNLDQKSKDLLKDFPH